jgi:DNA repair protein RadC
MQRISVVKILMEKERNLMVENKKIGSPRDAADIATEFLKGADREYLIVLALDTKNKVNSIDTVSVGSLNSSIVHPREVFKSLVLSNAASFILAHNHPSGDCSPSNEDVNITQRIKEAGKILGIELLDHIIVGDNQYISLKEKGIL